LHVAYIGHTHTHIPVNTDNSLDYFTKDCQLIPIIAQVHRDIAADTSIHQAVILVCISWFNTHTCMHIYMHARMIHTDMYA
jgi:hypothetical protein